MKQENIRVCNEMKSHNIWLEICILQYWRNKVVEYRHMNNSNIIILIDNFIYKDIHYLGFIISDQDYDRNSSWFLRKKIATHK